MPVDTNFKKNQSVRSIIISRFLVSQSRSVRSNIKLLGYSESVMYSEINHVLSEDDDDVSVEDVNAFIPQFVTIYQNNSILLNSVDQHIQQAKRKRDGVRLDTRTIPRERKTVAQVHRELGPGYFWRSFRMTFSTFQRLSDLLQPYLI